MRRLIWLPVAGFLLIAGAAAASAAPDVVRQAQSIVDEVATDDPGEPATELGLKFRDGLLEQVLDELVSAGTLTQEQADAIVGAIEDKIDARRAEAERLRELWQGFIEDGVISQDEIDQLPGDSPLREAWNSIAEDGQVTLEQLRGLHPFGGHRGPGGFFRGHHGGFEMPKPAPGDSEELPSDGQGS